jgi:hypothetical protein
VLLPHRPVAHLQPLLLLLLLPLMAVVVPVVPTEPQELQPQHHLTLLLLLLLKVPPHQRFHCLRPLLPLPRPASLPQPQQLLLPPAAS